MPYQGADMCVRCKHGVLSCWAFRCCAKEAEVVQGCGLAPVCENSLFVAIMPYWCRVGMGEK